MSACGFHYLKQFRSFLLHVRLKLGLMASLFAQLIDAGFPFGNVHASALAVALIESDATDINDVKYIDVADLRAIVDDAKCPDIVLDWLQRPASKPRGVACTVLNNKRRIPDAPCASNLAVAVDEAFQTTAPLRVIDCGPSKAAKNLVLAPPDTEKWLQDSRFAAIAGSCPRTHASLRSSVRAYCMFALKVNRPALPPSIDMLLSWSTLFRSKGTFQNYLTNIRTACQLVGLDTSTMHDRLLSKAIRAIEKRRDYIARQPMFLGENLIRKLVAYGMASLEPGSIAVAMLFLATYEFLLRLPSECLPLRVASLEIQVTLHCKRS